MLAIVVNAVIMSDCQDNYSSICLCLALLNTFSLENPIYRACIAVLKPHEVELIVFSQFTLPGVFSSSG